MSGNGISWAICKSAPRPGQINMPASHHSVFLQAGCPSCHSTSSVKALKACMICYKSAINSICLQWWGAGVVICLGLGADLHMAQLMPLSLTVSCSSKSRLVLPFWYWLTAVVLDRCLSVCYNIIIYHIQVASCFETVVWESGRASKL